MSKGKSTNEIKDGNLTAYFNGHEWDVYNKRNEFLGFIEYYKKWKKLVWEQCEEVILSRGCLLSIVRIMGEIECVNDD